MPKSVWTAFVLHLPILISYLTEPRTVFLKSENLIFSIVVGVFDFAFCFRLNIFTSKISKSLLPLGTEGARDHES